MKTFKFEFDTEDVNTLITALRFELAKNKDRPDTVAIIQKTLDNLYKQM